MHIEKIERIKRRLNKVTTLRGSFITLAWLSASLVVAFWAVNVNFVFGVVVFALSLGVTIWVIIKKRLFARASKDQASLFLDSYFGTKERLTTYQQIVKAKIHSDKKQAILLDQQLERLLPDFDEKKLIPFVLDSGLRVAFIVIMIACSQIVFSLFNLWNRTESTEEQRAAEIEKLLSDEEALPEVVREDLQNLAEALQNNELISEAVASALQDSQIEVKAAQKEIATVQEIKNGFSREPEVKGQVEVPTVTPTVSLHEEEQTAEQDQTEETESPSEDSNVEPEESQEKGDSRQEESSGNKSGSGSQQSEQESEQSQDGAGNKGGAGDGEGQDGSGRMESKPGDQAGNASGDIEDHDQDGGMEKQSGSDPSGEKKSDESEQQEGDEANKEEGARGNSNQENPSEEGEKSGDSEGKSGTGEQGSQSEADRLQKGLEKAQELLDALDKEIGELEGTEENGNDRKTESGSQPQPQKGQESGTDQSNDNSSENTAEQHGLEQGDPAQQTQSDKSEDNNLEQASKKDNDTEPSAGVLVEESQAVREMEPEIGEDGGSTDRSRPITSKVEISQEDEQYDESYVSSEGELVEHKGGIAPATKLGEVILARPDAVSDQEQQPIPLEYRDILK